VLAALLTQSLGGGVTVAVPLGTLTLTGFAPTVLTPRLISVPLGTLTLTGFAPTVLTPRLVSVPVGTLTLTGFAPVVGTTGIVAVPTGTLTLSGFAPTVLTPRTVPVPLGTLTLSGFAPTVLTPRTIAVPLGTLTLTGFAPTVVVGGGVTVLVPVGDLTLVGYAPEVVVGGVGVEPPHGGGWWPYWWRREQERRREERERIEILREETEQIPDALDREIAKLERDIESETQRKTELARLKAAADQHGKDSTEYEYNERVVAAFDRAVRYGNYSALEALDREMLRAHDEADFFLLAVTLILTED
jgi:hypothetical protein